MAGHLMIDTNDDCVWDALIPTDRICSREDGERRGIVLLMPRPLQRYLPSLSTCQLLQPGSSQLAQVWMISKMRVHIFENDIVKIMIMKSKNKK